MTETNQTPLFIRLRATLAEDLHTGSGTGSGDIDALVLRNRHGLPVIRASHFKGLLREAGEELIDLNALNQKDLDALLGTPKSTRGALRMTSLRLRKNGATLVWGASAREENSRAPLPDTLRYVEHIAAGSVFTACLRLPDSRYKPLLERLLRRVDRIGGGRNRGGGLVRLAWLTVNASPKTGSVKYQGTRLRLVFRNLEPLCLPATGHPGNLIRTFSFIRGQTLRGALMAWAIQTGRTNALSLFQNLSVGDALVLPAEFETAATVLPIPLSILTPKPSGGNPDIPWWADAPADPTAFDSLYAEKDPKAEKPKRPGEHEYLCRSKTGNAWLRYSPTLNVRLRNATPKRLSKTDAELFSLEEIAEDTRFQTELYFVDAATMEQFMTAFSPLLASGDWLAVGRGGVPVVLETVMAVTKAENAISDEVPESGFSDDWSLTLTSDLIVRGPHLGFLDDLDIGSLCDLADISQPDDNAWKISQAVTESERIYGFNATSGLSRAPALAIRRGSCWRITGSGSATLAEALAAKLALGERVQEGFGRFRIDKQAISPAPKSFKTRQGQVNRNETLLANAKQLAGKIDPVKGPSLSQLQWLRERALAAATIDDLSRLLTEIETASQRRPQGGKAWQYFPVEPLKQALVKLECEDKDRELQNKRQLISYLVQWRAPKAKEQRK